MGQAAAGAGSNCSGYRKDSNLAAVQVQRWIDEVTASAATISPGRRVFPFYILKTSGNSFCYFD